VGDDVPISKCYTLENKIQEGYVDKERMDTTMQSDRWSYLWLAVGTLVLLLWRMPLVWWLSPVFLLRFMRTQKVGRGFFLIWLSNFLTGIPPMYSIMNTLMPSPLPVLLIITAVTALMMGGIAYLVDRLLAPRLKGFAATLVFPYLSLHWRPVRLAGDSRIFGHHRLGGGSRAQGKSSPLRNNRVIGEGG
jgi:hypothetical protein